MNESCVPGVYKCVTAAMLTLLCFPQVPLLCLFFGLYSSKYRSIKVVLFIESEFNIYVIRGKKANGWEFTVNFFKHP